MLIVSSRASVLAVMLMLAAPALAQGPGGGGPGGGGRGGRGGFGGGFGGRGNSPFSLLSVAAVQDELGLSDEQKTKSTELVEQMRESQRGEGPQAGGGGQNFREMSDEERRERFATMMKEAEERNAKVMAEYKPKFAAVLDEAQLQRLQQISWQSQGTRALRDPELVKALGLSEDQQAKINTLFEESRGQGFGGRGGNGGDGANQDREARRAEMQARAERLNTDVKAVLTDSQKTAYADLMGPEFDVSQLRGPGGPGGPGGNRGPGGEGGPGRTRPSRPDNI